MSRPYPPRAPMFDNPLRDNRPVPPPCRIPYEHEAPLPGNANFVRWPPGLAFLIEDRNLPLACTAALLVRFARRLEPVETECQLYLPQL
jgi:hypothetical protein